MDTILIVATILGGVAAIGYFGDKFVGWIRRDVPADPHDIELYARYKTLFIAGGVAEFYRQHDFLSSFPQARWSPLSQYVDTWDNVEHEFSDKQLQKAHRKVYGAALKLGSAIAKNTVPVGDGSSRSVKPDNLPLGPTPEDIKNEAKEINDAVPAFADAHRAFVRLANGRLRKQHD